MSSKRKRIAMISHSLFNIDDRIRRHVANLVELGYDVDMMSLSYGSEGNVADREHVRFFFPRERNFKKDSQLRAIMEYFVFGAKCGWIMLRTHLFDTRISFVHVNNMPNFLVFFALPLRLMGVRILLDVHDAVPEIYQDKFAGRLLKLVLPLLFLEERLSMLFSNYVICTEHTKFKRLLQNGLKLRKGTVVMNAADPVIWDRSQVTPSERKDSLFRLVYHGTITRRLGLESAILAVKDLVEIIPNIRYDIIGDGDQRLELKKMVEDLGLSAHVFISDGFVSFDKLPELLKDMDVAVVPCRNSVATKLALSGKLLEYIVFGIPCIATDIPTQAYYFNDNQIKFFHSDDVETLKSHILFLYEHPEERERLVSEARKFLEEHDYESECETYKSVAKCLVEKNWDELRSISEACKL